MSAVFDLHLHTCWSYDATAPVEYYFSQAVKSGISHIAVTEHHHMDSIGEVQLAAAEYPEVNYFPAAELTVYSPLGTFDMVCLGLPVKPGKELQRVFDIYHQWQRDYGDATSAGLTAAGYPYSREDRLALLRRYRPEKAIEVQGVTHVQNGCQFGYLIDEKKYFADIEACRRVLRTLDRPHYPAAELVIPAVKRAGGIVFLAHPADYFNRDDENRMDALRECLDFDGIECAHPHVPEELTAVYRKYCLKHKLLSSGGSDRHTVPVDIDPAHPGMVGGHIGDPRWLAEILERIKPLRGV